MEPRGDPSVPCRPSNASGGGTGQDWSSRLAGFGTAGASWQRSSGSEGTLAQAGTRLSNACPLPPVSNTSGTAAFPLLAWLELHQSCLRGRIYDLHTLDHKLPASTASRTLDTLPSALFERPDSTLIPFLEQSNNHVYPANNHLQGRHLRGRRQFPPLPLYDISTRTMQRTDMQNSNPASHTR